MTAPDSAIPEVAPDLPGESDGSAPAIDSDIERGTVSAVPAHKGWLAAAIGLSLALHAGIAALFFLTPAGEALSRAIAGARSTGLAAAGDAAANKVAGSASATEEKAVAVTLVQPSAPPRPPTPPQPTQQQPQVQPQPRQKPATPAENHAAPTPSPQDILTADTAGPQGVVPPATTEPDTPSPPPVVPTPTARPTPPKNEDRQTAARSEPAPQGGKAAARRGAAGGTTAGRQDSTAEGRSDSGSGNAATSNYPGKIAGKLNRSLRYPAEAARRGLKGDATIQFTIQASGAVGEVRVITTSGSDILDQAAIDTVKRAAPFPPIPEAADRKAWPFIVTLAFGK